MFFFQDGQQVRLVKGSKVGYVPILAHGMLIVKPTELNAAV